MYLPQPLVLLCGQGIGLLLLLQGLLLGGQELPQLLQRCLLLELVLLPEVGTCTGACTASVSGFSLQS